MKVKMLFGNKIWKMAFHQTCERKIKFEIIIYSLLFFISGGSLIDDVLTIYDFYSFVSETTVLMSFVVGFWRHADGTLHVQSSDWAHSRLNHCESVLLLSETERRDEWCTTQCTCKPREVRVWADLSAGNHQSCEMAIDYTQSEDSQHDGGSSSGHPSTSLSLLDWILLTFVKSAT